jgi:hypothetical protein
MALPRIAAGAFRILSTSVKYVGVIDEAKNLAASDKMQGFFASLRMTDVLVVLKVRGPS